MVISFKSKKGYFSGVVKCIWNEQGKGPFGTFLFNQSIFVDGIYGVRELEWLLYFINFKIEYLRI